MSRAFLLADSSSYNTQKAERYGKRVFIFDHEPHPLNISAMVETVANRLDEMGFDPSVDYIVLTGNNVSIAMLCATVAAQWGSFNVLAYDAKSGYYVSRSFTPAA